MANKIEKPATVSITIEALLAETASARLACNKTSQPITFTYASVEPQIKTPADASKRPFLVFNLISENGDVEVLPTEVKLFARSQGKFLATNADLLAFLTEGNTIPLTPEATVRKDATGKDVTYYNWRVKA